MKEYFSVDPQRLRNAVNNIWFIIRNIMYTYLQSISSE